MVLSSSGEHTGILAGAIAANAPARASFPAVPAKQYCNFQHAFASRELLQATSVSYRGTAAADKIALRFDAFPNIGRRNQMVITAAHIQPIVALLAGVLILIMPRFLNLVVAIYLIFVGLAGLGLFKMLKM
jgi:hypothetical protein